MTKYHVHFFDYRFQKGLGKKKNFRWIRLNPETTRSAELKIKGSKNWPLRRKEKSKQTLTGIKGQVLERVTRCQPSRPGPDKQPLTVRVGHGMAQK